MKNAFLFCLVILFISCQSQTKNEKNSEIDQSAKPIAKEQLNVISEQVIILYNPPEAKAEILENSMDVETLSEIEYDKTLAVEFLSEKGVNYIVKSDSIYTFKLSNDELISVNTSDYQNWGIIFFKPTSSPKVIFLNQLIDEYDTFFNE